MNVTRYHSIEMTNVIIFVFIYQATIVTFFLISLHKKVSHILFWYLMVLLQYDILIFGLKHQLALAFFKET